MPPPPNSGYCLTLGTRAHAACSVFLLLILAGAALGSANTQKGSISETRLHLASGGTGARETKSLVWLFCRVFFCFVFLVFIFFGLWKRLVIFLALYVHMH